jgi:hypothetical protein
MFHGQPDPIDDTRPFLHTREWKGCFSINAAIPESC